MKLQMTHFHLKANTGNDLLRKFVMWSFQLTLLLFEFDGFLLE